MMLWECPHFSGIFSLVLFLLHVQEHTHLPYRHTQSFVSTRESPINTYSFIHPIEVLHGQLFNQNKSPETGRVQQRRMWGIQNVLSISGWGSAHSKKLKQEIEWMEQTGLLFLRGLRCGPITKGLSSQFSRLKFQQWRLWVRIRQGVTGVWATHWNRLFHSQIFS